MGTKPNVLILLSDQQRHDTVAAAGYPHMQTPALDSLAREGVLYENAYSSNPVCMPARHDLLTGMTGRAHGYFLNGKHPMRDMGLATLPRLFLNAGYRTAAVGKMHFFPVREHHGFGEMRLMEELPLRRQDDAYATWLAGQGLGHVQNLHGVRPYIYHTPQVAQQDEAHHGSTWVADRSIDWLTENADEPFFLMCGFIHPHPPWNIPPSLLSQYDGAAIPPPIPRSRNAQDGNEDNPWFGDNDTPHAIRQMRAAYYTAVSLVDKSIGRILDCLRAAGRLDNTLVIFTSDHGEMLCDKGYYSKELPYEGAARIPFIVRYPEKARQGRSPRLTTLLDIFPTCLDICGLTAPPTPRPGLSLLSPQNPAMLFSASGTGKWRWAMARDARYKYIHFYNGGLDEAYDLQDDPMELSNLLAGPATPVPAISALREALLNHEAAYGPEDALRHGAWVDTPFEKLHPSVRGKYHLWQNRQMQAFDHSPGRKERLLGEMRHALKDTRFSGATPAALLNDPEWRNQFAHCLRQYEEGEDPNNA